MIMWTPALILLALPLLLLLPFAAEYGMDSLADKVAFTHQVHSSMRFVAYVLPACMLPYLIGKLRTRRWLKVLLMVFSVLVALIYLVLGLLLSHRKPHCESRGDRYPHPISTEPPVPCE